MAKEKRYWKYVFEDTELQKKSLESKTPYEAIAFKFSDGSMKVLKKSDELIQPENGEAIFDNKSGNIYINVNGKAVWGSPGYPCPDCDGYISLRKKFFKVGSPNSPWFYLCQNRETDGCKVVVPAKKNGTLQYLPSSKETREARKLTNEMFERLWKQTPDMLDWSGDPDDLKKVIQSAKGRAYRFLSHKMTEQNAGETQISKMDIPTLRIAYRICKDADLNEVMKFGKIY
jgi:hypothetical protein